MPTGASSAHAQEYFRRSGLLPYTTSTKTLRVWPRNRLPYNLRVETAVEGE
jgi:hypothetical protein